jgi:metallo-beta-lactamase class B
MPQTKVPQQKERIVIRQRERQPRSHWQRTHAVPAIASVSLVLCATTAIGAEKNYTKVFEDTFNMTMPAAWSQNYPATQIIGNLYDVGGYDLSSFLITSDAGHILINTGLEGSAAMIESNLTSLGLRMADIKILLTTQAHFDHTADLALIKEQTGARLLATDADKSFLEDGGFSDPLLGGIESFRPVTVDGVIADGDVIAVGDIRLSVLEHPGHTEGSASYAMRITESGNSYDVLVVNMAYINEGVNVAIKPTYHDIAADFEKTFESQRKLSPDVWVSSHKSAYGFHEKHAPGQAYDPRAFYDPAGYVEAVRLHEVTFVNKVYDELLGKIADNHKANEENGTK